jgi:DUF971 family protein
VQLTKFKKTGEGNVDVGWDDGHQGRISLPSLRDHCPCAGCQGETVLLRTYSPPPANRNTPGRYVLTGANQVGNYGIQLRWEDGHGEGIYTWEGLRELCECGECGRERLN